MTNAQNNFSTAKASPAAWLELLQSQLRGLKFGVVQIVVHEGRVVQIERTEKLRLENKDGLTQPARAPE